MTLIVSLQGIDGLILAGDSRGTVGDPRGLTAINDSYIKIFKLSKYCGIGISGASEIATKIIDELRTQLAGNKNEFADDILNDTRNLVRARYDDWFGKFPLEKRPALILSLIGYQKIDDKNFIPRTYMLASPIDFAPQLMPNGNCLSGVPQYALYLMNRFYVPEMTIESLARLAVYLISETATQDPKVGGPIQLATITPHNGYNEITKKDVEKIVELNNKENEKLKQFFFGG